MEAGRRLIRPLAAALLLGAAWWGSPQFPVHAREPVRVEQRSFGPAAVDPVGEAFRARRSHLTLTVEARVRRILPDDRSGSRHQRFIITTRSGVDVLVAHNIDLAPRVPGLQPGEALELRGEYIWNPKGGVLHWTHHDPRGRHVGGYIERNGRRYD